MTQSQIIKLLIKVAGTQSNLAKIAESSQGQISDYHKCEGLSLPYLAAGSNVKNVLDLHRNKKILP